MADLCAAANELRRVVRINGSDPAPPYIKCSLEVIDAAADLLEAVFMTLETDTGEDVWRAAETLAAAILPADD